MIINIGWSIIDFVLIGITGVIAVSIVPILNYSFNRENQLINKGDKNGQK